MTLKERVWRFKARLVRRALVIAKGNVSDAADLLGVHRAAIYQTARRCGIEIAKVRRRGSYVGIERALQGEAPAPRPRKSYFGVDLTP